MSKYSGTINLCDVDGNISQQKRYKTKVCRNKIIEKRKQIYVLEKRNNFFIGIIPDVLEEKEKKRKK